MYRRHVCTSLTQRTRGHVRLCVGDEGRELAEVGLGEAELLAVGKGLVHQVVPVEEGVLGLFIV